MTEVKIITEDEGKDKEKKPVEKVEVEEAIQKADEIQKLKEENDRLEIEVLRRSQLQARLALSGKGEAGDSEKSEEDKVKEEAAKHLSLFDSK